MNLLKRTCYNIYKLYYRLVRGCKWDSQRDFIAPYGSLIQHNASVSRINELRKKVYLSTITIVEKGYYDVKEICVKLDSNEVAVNSIFYSEKFEVNSIKGIGCDTIITVVNSDSLEEGIRLLDLGYNPAILNMANRHYPGGGTTNGSIGQEEDIFRRTNIRRLVKDLRLKCQSVNTQWIATTVQYIPQGLPYFVRMQKMDMR